MRDIQVTGDNTHLLAELNQQGVRYLIVGGVAVHYHAPERKYDDLDILLDLSAANAERCFVALQKLVEKPAFTAAHLTRPNQQLQLKRFYYADVITPMPDVDFAGELEALCRSAYQWSARADCLYRFAHEHEGHAATKGHAGC